MSRNRVVTEVANQPFYLANLGYRNPNLTTLLLMLSCDNTRHSNPGGTTHSLIGDGSNGTLKAAEMKLIDGAIEVTFFDWIG